MKRNPLISDPQRFQVWYMEKDGHGDPLWTYYGDYPTHLKALLAANAAGRSDFHYAVTIRDIINGGEEWIKFPVTFNRNPARLITIQDLQRKFIRRMPRRFIPDIQRYINVGEVQDYLHKALKYGLTDAERNHIFRIGQHKLGMPFPHLYWLCFIYIHPLTAVQAIVARSPQMKLAVADIFRNPQSAIRNPLVKMNEWYKGAGEVTPSEWAVHCGHAYRQLKGWRFIGNNWVEIETDKGRVQGTPGELLSDEVKRKIGYFDNTLKVNPHIEIYRNDETGWHMWWSTPGHGIEVFNVKGNYGDLALPGNIGKKFFVYWNQEARNIPLFLKEKAERLLRDSM